jgi:hypothetical protein
MRSPAANPGALWLRTRFEITPNTQGYTNPTICRFGERIYEGRTMTQHIQVKGWAPDGEPKALSPLAAEFSVELSEFPGPDWVSAFRELAARFSRMHANVTYEVIDNSIKVKCPPGLIANVTDGLKNDNGLVDQVNAAAAARQEKAASDKRTQHDPLAQVRAMIKAEIQKVDFSKRWK